MAFLAVRGAVRMRHLARQLLQLLMAATAISGDGRNERRQRVLSLLQTHDTTPSPRSRVRFSFTPSFSGSAGGSEATQQLPPIFNTWVRIRKRTKYRFYNDRNSGDLGVVESEYK